MTDRQDQAELVEDEAVADEAVESKSDLATDAALEATEEAAPTHVVIPLDGLLAAELTDGEKVVDDEYEEVVEVVEEEKAAEEAAEETTEEEPSGEVKEAVEEIESGDTVVVESTEELGEALSDGEKAELTAGVHEVDSPVEIPSDDEKGEMGEMTPEQIAARRQQLLDELAALNRASAPAAPKVVMEDGEDERAMAMRKRRDAMLERLGLKTEEAAEDDFLCGKQRKMLPNGQPCDYCRGGCAPEGDLPGLLDIEMRAEDEYKGEVIRSGFGPEDQMFAVDVKREDGSTIEAFYSGEGKQAGWILLDSALVEAAEAEGKDALAGQKIISMGEAEEVALKNIEGTAIGAEVGIFEGYDAYVFQVDTLDGKSFDAYVGIDGSYLGYDEFEVIDDGGVGDDEADQKALEAELELKKAFSDEKREELAKTGDAMSDGSYPIKNVQDLKNAIMAVGRAKNPELAKAHIMKRAVQLGEEALIPEKWLAKDKKKVLGDEYLASLNELETIEADLGLAQEEN